MRQTTSEALPYLHVEDQDIEAEFKLDADECKFPMEQDEHVALCLLKLKRMQALLVERQNVSARQIPQCFIICSSGIRT